MKKLTSSRFRGAEFKRNAWRASPANGETLEDVMKPEYWTHVAAQLRPLDRIEVVPEDMSFFAELLVTKCDRLFAKTVVITHVPLTEEAKPAAKPVPAGNGVEYKVEWKGGAKFCVIRSDGEVISKGHAAKEDAQTALDEYLKQAA